MPAEGVVLYNGDPLPWAAVTMVPITSGSTAGGETFSRPSAAVTDGNGFFRLQTLGEPGTLPGEYCVRVARQVPNEGPGTLRKWKEMRRTGAPDPMPEEEVLDVVSVLPEKYDDPRKSGLTVTVGEDGNRDIRLEITDP
ncbi:MAG: hypothetical protein Q4C47_00535 [Planctomycetia bacterium]|nr:hypothetical protein [Planctomycetia bacterium]